MKPLILQPHFWCISLLCLVPFLGNAQVNETFSDGDFTQNPIWTGDVADFGVNAALQLRLVSTGVDTSALVTPNTQMDDTEWNAWFRLAFAPSDNNYVRYYLVSDQADIKQPLNGYFLRYGENGGADGLDLWRQNGTVLTKLIDGAPNAAAASGNQQIRFRVTRSAAGHWQLWADYLGGYAYQALGNVTDTTHTATACLGVYCKYTGSNASGFYLDDVYAGAILVDAVPPTVVSVSAPAADTLRVQFSEPVTPASAAVVSAYGLNNGIGNPEAVLYDVSQPDVVKLKLGNALVPVQPYAISIQDVKDFAGNVMVPFSGQVLFYQPQPYDVLISEIMADPSPAVGLPEVEYIELYNTRSIPLDVTGWKLKVGSTLRTLPAATLPADSFLLLTVSPLPAGFSGIHALAVPSFPSLTNSGATVSVYTAADSLLHEVAYTPAWYNNPDKEDGGWSLEMINPLALCGGGDNWAASNDITGGTPGRTNSVHNPQPTAFSVVSAEAVGDRRVAVNFNQMADTLQWIPSRFTVNPGVGTPDSVRVTGTRSCLLYFSEPFSPLTAYTVTVDGTLTNCAQQPVTGTLSVPFTFYVAQPYDVLITEVMADELPSQGLPPFEYVELHNRAPVPISLGGWQFSAGNSSVDIPAYQLPAGGYITLASEEAEGLFPAGVLGVPGFSGLSNSGAVLTLRTPQGTLVHTVAYTEAWHTESAKRGGGWSLEMKDVNNPCAGKENWASSRHVSGGTPGAENSVKQPLADVQRPFPVRVGIPSADSVLVYFSEPLRQRDVLPERFSVTGGMGTPAAVLLEEPYQNTVALKLMNFMQPGTPYELTFTDSLRDCAGNLLEVNVPLRLQLPEIPSVADLVLNEVLFDSKAGGQEYVEVYNRSGKAVDLRWLSLCNYDSASNSLTDVFALATRPALLMPGQYLLLSRDKTDIYYRYFTQDPTAFWDMVSWPSLGNGGGSLALADDNLAILDAFTFTDAFHFSLLYNKDGVSLERMNPDGITQTPYNWTSAAASVGYGTPGYRNSQWGTGAEPTGTLTLWPEIFSPDQDGFDDVLSIRYEFASPGNVLSIHIYDELGRTVKKLVDGEYTGTAGTYTWDGGTDSGLHPKVGIYVVMAEWFNAQGEKGRAKKAVVLAARL